MTYRYMNYMHVCFDLREYLVAIIDKSVLRDRGNCEESPALLLSELFLIHIKLISDVWHYYQLCS